MGHGQHIRQRDERDLRRQQAVGPTPPGERERPGGNRDQYRRVREESVHLIEEQPAHAARDVRGSAKVGSTVRDGWIRGAVHGDEERHPGQRTQAGHDEEGGRLGGRTTGPCEVEQDQRADASGEQRKARVQPGQQRQRKAVQQPRPGRVRLVGPLLARPDQRPHAGQDNEPGRTIRIHGEGIEELRRRQHERRPPEPRGRRAAGHPPGQLEGQARSHRGQEQEEHHDPAVAADQERGSDQRRKAGGVDRVDLAVPPAPQVVRLREIAGEVRAVVAPQVVVLDREIVIAQETLGDDQVVRLVAARAGRGDGPRGTRVDHQRQCRGPNRQGVRWQRNQSPRHG